MKALLAVLLLPALAWCAILPDAIGPYHRGDVSQPAMPDRAVWDEYGLKEAETAAYEGDAGKFNLTAWHLQDSTGAMAAFEWQRPANSTPSAAAKMAAETKDSLLVLYGSYVLSFTGHKPDAAELDQVYGNLKNVDRTPLPSLYLPSQNLAANSDRYITGPVALQKFVPGIPPSVAAFHMGAEAQSGVFHSAKGDSTVVVFSYPTPQIAMQRVPEFQKLPGAMVKRSGPLVAVTLAPADPDLAEHVLSQIKYLADVTLQEHIWTRRDNIGNLVINAFILIGILLGFALVSGLAVGGVRAWMRRGSGNPDADTLISLHLQ